MTGTAEYAAKTHSARGAPAPRKNKGENRMKLIEASSEYEYEKLFDALDDNESGRFETVGKDGSGDFILHTGVKNGQSGAYYVITPEEFSEYLEKARKNGLVGFLKNRKLQSLVHDAGLPAKGSITSFEYVTLRVMGMRFTNEYELLMKNGKAELSQYAVRYGSGDREDTRVLEKRAECSESEALDLLNGCGVLLWNGFHGAHPRGVLDGTMFRLKAKVNGETTVTADGSQNFPKHYHDLTDGFYKLLYRE